MFSAIIRDTLHISIEYHTVFRHRIAVGQYSAFPFHKSIINCNFVQ
jgi:hypothetical protein